jgi:hypothetical protein
MAKQSSEQEQAPFDASREPFYTSSLHAAHLYSFKIPPILLNLVLLSRSWSFLKRSIQASSSAVADRSVPSFSTIVKGVSQKMPTSVLSGNVTSSSRGVSPSGNEAEPAG